MGKSSLQGWIFACISVVLMGTQAHAAIEVARPADAVPDSIGVNVHASFYTSAFNNWQGVINAIDDIGIRAVRDHPFDITRLNQLTAATGAKVCAIIQYEDGVTNGPPVQLIQSKLPDVLNDAKQLTGLGWLEGPNEYDWSADWEHWDLRLRPWMTEMYTRAKADPVLASKPVIAPSLWNAAPVSDLGAYVDRRNTHSYHASNNPTYDLDNHINRASLLAPDKPIISTETGYADNWSISETATGKYVPRLFMEYFNRGFEKTFLYELLDQNSWASRENHFGLLRNDFSYKPSAVALKNLIALLSDEGQSFAPGSLEFTITGGDANLHHTLLQKHDGTYYLAIWQDAYSYDTVNNVDLTVPEVPVTIDFASPLLAGAKLYIPNDSASALTTWGGQLSQIHLNVQDRVMLLQLNAVPEPAGAMLVLACTGLIGWRRRSRCAASR